METTIFEVKFYDGRKFRVFCYGKNQKNRFKEVAKNLKKEIQSVQVLTTGIHTIKEFEKITTNLY